MQHNTVICLVLAFLIAFSGCVGFSSSDQNEGSSSKAVEIQEEAISSMEDLNSYSFEFSMTSESKEGTAEMEIYSKVDLEERKAEMDSRLDVRGRSVEIKSYIVNDTMYAKTRGTWKEMSLSSQFWDENHQISRQKELLEVSDVTLVDNRSVNGVQTHVIEVKPQDMDEFKNQLMDAISRQGSGDSMETLKRGELKEVTYKYYIGKQKKYLRKLDIDMVVEIKGQEVEVTGEMVFSDYNEEMEIQIPEKARDGMIG